MKLQKTKKLSLSQMMQKKELTEQEKSRISGGHGHLTWPKKRG